MKMGRRLSRARGIGRLDSDMRPPRVRQLPTGVT
jgi:hypothetical protein